MRPWSSPSARCGWLAGSRGRFAKPLTRVWRAWLASCCSACSRQPSATSRGAWLRRNFGASCAASFLNLVPPVALLILFALLGEVPTGATWLGGIAAIASVLVVNLPQGRLDENAVVHRLDGGQARPATDQAGEIVVDLPIIQAA